MAVQLDEFGMVVLSSGNSGGGGGGGSSAKYYKCASVNTTAHTWTGYLAIRDSATGAWSFSETETTGLSYGANPDPEVGNVYDENGVLMGLCSVTYSE